MPLSVIEVLIVFATSPTMTFTMISLASGEYLRNC
jgi:hypothetical protein